MSKANGKNDGIWKNKRFDRLKTRATQKLASQQHDLDYKIGEIKIDEFEKLIEGNPSVVRGEFKNEYGELFKMYYDGITVVFGGDETDNKAMPLFNQNFDIFSTEELHEIGKFLTNLGGEL